MTTADFGQSLFMFILFFPLPQLPLAFVFLNTDSSLGKARDGRDHSAHVEADSGWAAEDGSGFFFSFFFPVYLLTQHSNQPCVCEWGWAFARERAAAMQRLCGRSAQINGPAYLNVFPSVSVITHELLRGLGWKFQQYIFESFASF